MVFCFENCSDLLCDINALVISKFESEEPRICKKKIEIIKACPFLNFDFVLIWADVFLKMIMILKELRIAQP